MLFVILISITHEIKFINDDVSLEASPIPISVPVDAMITNIDLATNCQTEIQCKDDNINNPICGKECWSNKSGDDYFEYSFKGVKFEIYGSYSHNNGDFSVYINDTLYNTKSLYSSSSEIHHTKVFSSNNLEYGTHKLKIQGIDQHRFEIYKITFWPSLQAVRVNASDLFTSKSWSEESDNIGGIRAYSDANKASKRGVFECSKVWIYGTKDYVLGKMSINFGSETKDIDEFSSQKEELSLIYESEEVQFNKYELSINRVENRILIYYIYYLFDAPEQTPIPTEIYTPDLEAAYINKKFDNNNLPNDRVLIKTDSAVNQISGCNFTNIECDPDYFIRIDKEIQFFDNTIENTDTTKKYPSFIHITYEGKITIQNCKFLNARCTNDIDIKGNIFYADTKINTKFESCYFIDCGINTKEQLILQRNPESSLQFHDCIFKFNDIDQSCKVLYTTSSNSIINQCTFYKCGIESICMPCSSSSGVFEFTNNNIQFVKEQFILINNLKTKPVFSGNMFKDINIEGGYFITINHDWPEIELYNNSFNKIASGNGKVYGGGLSLWFARKDRKKYDLIFEKCKFIDITNNNMDKPYNQGGAIQYGYSSSISNVSMIFQSCEFSGNKCTDKKSSGGALGININHDLTISDCIFKDHKVGYFGGCIYIWGKIVESGTGIERSCEMESIVIQNCEFINNSAFEGHVFYTNAENIQHVKLYITSCTFTDNGKVAGTSVIASDCENVVFENSTIQYTSKLVSSGLLKFNQILNSTVNNCTFINSTASEEGSIKYNGQKDKTITKVTNCNFINCRSTDSYIILIADGLCDLDGIYILFNDGDPGCGGIKFGKKGFTLLNSYFYKTNGAIQFEQIENNKDSIEVRGCTFDSCAGENVGCFKLNLYTSDFIFANNTIQNMMNTGRYFGEIDCHNKISTLELNQINFYNNICDSLYGGGSGLWITQVGTIKFNNCNFVNNIAQRSNSPRKQVQESDKRVDYYNGDGGAIQYGFSNSLCNINLLFDDCKFKNNKAVRHGGALALQTVGTVDITNCIFENNIAYYKQQTSELLDFNNYYSYKKEGRGGAIYLNPAFKNDETDPSKYMTNVNIIGCTFSSNSGFDGHAIYIEGDDPKTVFVIKNNQFIDNYDKNNPSNSKSIILSEILYLYDNKILQENTFTNKDISPTPLAYVNHYALPFQTTEPAAEPTKLPDDDDDLDTFEIINCTTFGHQEYIIDDDDGHTSTLIMVLISYFYNISSSHNGGALHVVNAGIICNYTTFINCSSGGAGGAMYVINKHNNKNFVTLIKNDVCLCKAQYGGGFYVYSSNRNNRVMIKYCTFKNNTALAPISDVNKYGGSGIYVTARKGRIKGNMFIDNEGEGSTFMMDNNYDDNDQKIGKLLEEEPFIVSDCYFEIKDSSDRGFSYVEGENGNLIQLKDCTFKGNLAKNGHVIDEKSISNGSHKLTIKNCKFSNSFSKTIVVNSKLNEKIFDQSDNVHKININKSKENAFIIVSTVIIITLIVIVGIIITAIKRNNSYASDEEEISSDSNEI